MFPGLLYLSSLDILNLKISPREARQAVISAFCDNAAGRNIGLPKSIINIAPGYLFQSMISTSQAGGIAVSKWVAAVPLQGGEERAGVNGLICVSDYNSGLPVAILDGNSITLIRTAAMSAAAAVHLAPAAPAVIGFVGCGLQALSHLDAFVDLFPSLRRVYLLSRSTRSAERLSSEASERNLEPIIVQDPEHLLRQSEVVISTVPNSQGLAQFLDARLLPASSFVSAVDGGRSWRHETLTAFDRLVTDSLAQSESLPDLSRTSAEALKFHDDLVHLATSSWRPDSPMRTLFTFQGFAIADLALAGLAIRKARASNLGTILPR